MYKLIEIFVFFKDCIGAIDGVHVPASLPQADQIPFIGRKKIPTQNVMAVCDFNMKFTFVYAGWEGSAHDSRVFSAALRDTEINFPKPSEGMTFFIYFLIIFYSFVLYTV